MVLLSEALEFQQENTMVKYDFSKPTCWLQDQEQIAAIIQEWEIHSGSN